MRIRIRDLVNPGSGMEKMGSRIWDQDEHPGSATLHKKMELYPVLPIGNVLVPKRSGTYLSFFFVADPVPVFSPSLKLGQVNSW
jgi:hypothetical protein